MSTLTDALTVTSSVNQGWASQERPSANGWQIGLMLILFVAGAVVVAVGGWWWLGGEWRQSLLIWGVGWAAAWVAAAYFTPWGRLLALICDLSERGMR